MDAVEVEKIANGRWIASIPQAAGVLAFGRTRKEAVQKAEALARRVVEENIPIKAGEVLDALRKAYPEGFEEGEIPELRFPIRIVDFE